jgi:hypothetical protein
MSAVTSESHTACVVALVGTVGNWKTLQKFNVVSDPNFQHVYFFSPFCYTSNLRSGLLAAAVCRHMYPAGSAACGL